MMEETRFSRGRPVSVKDDDNAAAVADGSVGNQLPIASAPLQDDNDTHDAGVGYTYPFPLPASRTKKLIIFAVVFVAVITASAITVLALWLNGTFGYATHTSEALPSTGVNNTMNERVNTSGGAPEAVTPIIFWTPAVPNVPVRRMHDITTFPPQPTIILPDITIYPHKFCTQNTSTNGSDVVLLAVITEPEDSALRVEYRHIWNQYLPYISGNLVFFLAVSHVPTIQETIKQEALQNGDILQLNTPTSSTEKYLKTLAALQWADENCPHKFMLRMNVDVLVQVESLKTMLDNALNKRLDHAAAILGDVIEEEGVADTSNFPKFVLGSFYIITRPAFRRLVEACQRVRPISLEEVYLTGSCADAGQVLRIKVEGVEMERELSLWRKMFSCLPVHVLSVNGVGKENIIHYWQKAVRAGCYV
ncbi:uncharacterized protein LOC129591894 [Paramacrobiotus metropolitanus]|uniref:uncharacterized protein LOC129591894 n=1 Tax=Paramacrobiotus metropolitanus TaxID=2943436 RepID=UPI0024460DDD|nr:uncharacterized protein LOC129591894 [Paramacrobiotus metropolitanus]